MTRSKLCIVRSKRLVAILLTCAWALVAAGCGEDSVGGGQNANQGPADMDGSCSGDAGFFCDASGEAICGDSQRDPGEACDDGNTRSGDGCSANCSRVERGWICPEVGACTEAERCGNGFVDVDEECDDGNADSGDGCDEQCRIEEGWTCSEPGEACAAAGCGDGRSVGQEECDDDNTNNGDGCSANCEVEEGWVCIDDSVCIARECGDGILAGEEACDDGDTDDGDGCAGDCASIEPNYVCPLPGEDCVSTVECGDRRVGPGEQCDDGNTMSGDGCTAMCQREQGWICPIPGARCRAEMCGDGIAVDDEQCDEDSDGCTSECRIEDGWACPPMMSCFQTTCGDGMREGTEQCDDGNTRPFDGCSPDCTNEPSCSGGVCTSICGDGVILPGPTQEACDDGNTSDGDGCSAMCTVEEGWSCTIEPEPLPSALELPVLVRDFKGIEWYADNATEYGHPDFNDPNDTNSSISFGIVESTLGPNGRPVLAYASADPNDSTGLPKARARFEEWYDSSSPWNREEVRTLTLTRTMGSDTFVYNSTATGFPPHSTSGFYPIDSGGWVAQGSEALRPSSNDSQDHNFNFTTETHFFFQYEGDEVLSFSGDDDLWVFIDGVLCLDIGGIHPARSGEMNLADPSQESNATQRAIVQSCKAHLDGLVTASNPKPLVEMVIFHAERHTTASNFELELTGFVRRSSVCAEECGDGVVTRGEVCDDGTNDGSYNGCADDCLSFGGYCGDDTINGPEVCDDGVDDNDGSYGGCNPDCTPAGSCGDGVVQPRHEVCDDGVNDGSYGSCSADCQMASARCGDGVVNGPEECDNGLGQNLGGYGGCNPDCTLGPYCGDGVLQPDEGEACDDGNQDNTDSCWNNCLRPAL